jgi:hypothetical protein
MVGVVFFGCSDSLGNFTERELLAPSLFNWCCITEADCKFEHDTGGLNKSGGGCAVYTKETITY